MLKSPTCTPARIELALQIMRDRMSREAVEKPHRLFFYLVTTTKELYVPPSAEERQRAALPEHVQEDVAASQQIIATRDARERAEADIVAALGHEQLAELVEQTLAELPDGPVRSVLMKHRDSARTFVLWVPEIYKRLRATRGQS
jgi:hypothetical protein